MCPKDSSIKSGATAEVEYEYEFPSGTRDFEIKSIVSEEYAETGDNEYEYDDVLMIVGKVVEGIPEDVEDPNDALDKLLSGDLIAANIRLLDGSGKDVPYPTPGKQHRIQYDVLYAGDNMGLNTYQVTISHSESVYVYKNGVLGTKTSIKNILPTD